MGQVPRQTNIGYPRQSLQAQRATGTPTNVYAQNTPFSNQTPKASVPRKIETDVSFKMHMMIQNVSNLSPPSTSDETLLERISEKHPDCGKFFFRFSPLSHKTKSNAHVIESDPFIPGEDEYEKILDFDITFSVPVFFTGFDVELCMYRTPKSFRNVVSRATEVESVVIGSEHIAYQKILEYQCSRADGQMATLDIIDTNSAKVCTVNTFCEVVPIPDGKLESRVNNVGPNSFGVTIRSVEPVVTSGVYKCEVVHKSTAKSVYEESSAVPEFWVENLVPSQEYICKTYYKNMCGSSDIVDVETKTADVGPSPPTEVRGVFSKKAIELSWANMGDVEPTAFRILYSDDNSKSWYELIRLHPIVCTKLRKQYKTTIGCLPSGQYRFIVVADYSSLWTKVSSPSEVVNVVIPKMEKHAPTIRKSESEEAFLIQCGLNENHKCVLHCFETGPSGVHKYFITDNGRLDMNKKYILLSQCLGDDAVNDMITPCSDIISI